MTPNQPVERIAAGQRRLQFRWRLMRRALSFVTFGVLVALLVGCDHRTEFVAPKEADYAVAVAKTYCRTSGIIGDPILQAAQFETQFQTGVWRLELVSVKTPKSDLDCWIIRVTQDGQILTTYGPH